MDMFDDVPDVSTEPSAAAGAGNTMSFMDDFVAACKQETARLDALEPGSPELAEFTAEREAYIASQRRKPWPHKNCWECGLPFSRSEMGPDGDWEEGYCGC